MNDVDEPKATTAVLAGQLSELLVLFEVKKKLELGKLMKIGYEIYSMRLLRSVFHFNIDGLTLRPYLQIEVDFLILPQ